MKNNRLPLYLVFVLVALAIVYRIAHPPAPPIPGPIGGIPTWRSTVSLGTMTGHAVNPAGNAWAGVWTDSAKNAKVHSALRIIDLDNYSAKSVVSPEDVCGDYLTWADDHTIRLVCSSDSAKGKGPGVVEIDASSGKVKSPAHFVAGATRILYWPNSSDVFIAETKGDGANTALGAYSMRGGADSLIGKQVSFQMPKDGEFYTDVAGIAADGSLFVFAVTDPAAKDGRSYWLADTKAGTSRKMFDLAEVPGKIEGIWPSAARVLFVCKVGSKYVDVVYDPATGKLAEQKDGVGDLAKWPGAPKSLGYTTIDGGFDFSLATGKNKTLFDMSKKTSYSDKQVKDIINSSRLYKLANGNYITISETSGSIDIHELKPDGSLYRAVLPR